MIYLYFQKIVSKYLLFLSLFLFFLIACDSRRVADKFNRKEQIFTILKNSGVSLQNKEGFVFILKSFGCSPCEEITYGFLNRLLKKQKLPDEKFIVVISNNDELLLRKKLYNDLKEKITYIILSDYEMAKYGLIFNNDLLIEIRDNAVINFLPITKDNLRKLSKRYLGKL